MTIRRRRRRFFIKIVHSKPSTVDNVSLSNETSITLLFSSSFWIRSVNVSQKVYERFEISKRRSSGHLTLKSKISPCPLLNCQRFDNLRIHKYFWFIDQIKIPGMKIIEGMWKVLYESFDHLPLPCWVWLKYPVRFLAYFEKRHDR